MAEPEIDPVARVASAVMASGMPYHGKTGYFACFREDYQGKRWLLVGSQSPDGAVAILATIRGADKAELRENLTAWLQQNGSKPALRGLIRRLS